MIGIRNGNEERARLLATGGIEHGEEFGERERLDQVHLWVSLGIAALLIPVVGYRGGAIALGTAVMFGGFVLLRRRRNRFVHREAFERDYPTLLIALASSVRAGLDPLVAIISARSLFPRESALRAELERFAEAIEAGLDEGLAIREFARSVQHPDVELLRTAYLLARREGSSLGECLHRLARVTRQRQSFRRKMRGAVAMQRLSAIGIAGCAILIALFQGVTNSRGVVEAISDPRGVAALSIGAALMLGGLLWMFHLVRARI